MTYDQIPDEPESQGLLSKILNRDKEYDERQRLSRYKVGYQCYLLSLIGLFLFKQCCPKEIDWQRQYLPFLCFSFAVLTYYVIACVFQDAYLTPKQTKKFHQTMFAEIFVVMCMYFMYFEDLHEYNNDLKTVAESVGRWTPKYPWATLLLAISATLIAVAMMIKQALIFRAQKEDQ